MNPVMKLNRVLKFSQQTSVAPLRVLLMDETVERAALPPGSEILSTSILEEVDQGIDDHGGNVRLGNDRNARPGGEPGVVLGVGRAKQERNAPARKQRGDREGAAVAQADVEHGRVDLAMLRVRKRFVLRARGRRHHAACVNDRLTQLHGDQWLVFRHQNPGTAQHPVFPSPLKLCVSLLIGQE